MQLAAVVTERDALSRVSTWPWQPSTLTAFVTTMVLPAIRLGAAAAADANGTMTGPRDVGAKVLDVR
jgi:hypothetical protein